MRADPDGGAIHFWPPLDDDAAILPKDVAGNEANLLPLGERRHRVLQACHPTFQSRRCTAGLERQKSRAATCRAHHPHSAIASAATAAAPRVSPCGAQGGARSARTRPGKTCARPGPRLR
eukprot:scaffold3513_cov127-Isochrysis_galbana.AAC.8